MSWDCSVHACAVIELDPTTTKYDEFIPLLEEKVADVPSVDNQSPFQDGTCPLCFCLNADEETAGSMGSDDEEAEANAEANDAGESEDGEEDEEEEEEGNEDEEDDDEEGEEEDEVRCAGLRQDYRLMDNSSPAVLIS
eukprot:365747-Chlamydomonas_euryale.AAC.44